MYASEYVSNLLHRSPESNNQPRKITLSVFIKRFVRERKAEWNQPLREKDCAIGTSWEYELFDCASITVYKSVDEPFSLLSISDPRNLLIALFMLMAGNQRKLILR